MERKMSQRGFRQNELHIENKWTWDGYFALSKGNWSTYPIKYLEIIREWLT